MADKHPYVSGSAPLFQVVAQLRKTFPAGGVTADTLKKFGLAKGNESYVINILRFIEVIDDEGKKTETAGKIFSQHDDAEFGKALSALVKKAYGELFSTYGEDAWKLEQNKLIQFFRSTDDTSAIVGQRQATTFQTLAALSGFAEGPVPKGSGQKKASAKSESAKKPAKAKAVDQKPSPTSSTPLGGAVVQSNAGLGLTVRIEINLPAGGDQNTYDQIFKSIRENLLNAK